MAQLELVPWVDLPKYVQVGFVSMGFMIALILVGLASMQCYDYDYFYESPRALAAYYGLAFLAGSFAFISFCLLIVAALLHSGILKVL